MALLNYSSLSLYQLAFSIPNSSARTFFLPYRIAASASCSEVSLERDAYCPFNQSGSVGILSPVGSMHGASSTGSESDWAEPTMLLYNSRPLIIDGYRNVMDAFRLLQINPFVQRTVVSLSSDKAVWDAVMNNEAVQELEELLRGSGLLPNKWFMFFR